jgi:hypothetical protein
VNRTWFALDGKRIRCVPPEIDRPNARRGRLPKRRELDRGSRSNGGPRRPRAVRQKDRDAEKVMLNNYHILPA